MNTKKTIKIVTATAIAASAFAAVAPAQSQAATSITIQINQAKATIKKPYDRYAKSSKLVSVATVEKDIKNAKIAKKDITAKVNKAKLTTKDKKKKLAEIKAYDKYITNAEKYVKAYKEAQAASAKLDALVAELQKAIEAGNTAKIQTQTAAINTTVTKAEDNIEKTVSETKVEDLLKNQFTEPAQPIVLAYSFTKKADQAKVNYYFKLVSGDLSTQEKIVSAQLVRSAINVNKLNPKSAVYSKLIAADQIVAAADAALKLKTTPATLATSSAALLAQDDTTVTTDTDAVYLTFSEPVKVVGNLTLTSKNDTAVTGNVTAVNQTAATGFDVDGNGKIEGTELNTVKVDIDLDSNTTYAFELAKGSVTDLDGNVNTEAITFNIKTDTFQPVSGQAQTSPDATQVVVEQK